MKNTNLKTNTTTIRLLISVVALMLTASLSIWGWRRTPNRIIPHAQEMKARRPRRNTGSAPISTEEGRRIPQRGRSA